MREKLIGEAQSCTLTPGLRHLREHQGDFILVLDGRDACIAMHVGRATGTSAR
jgi:hypothetical protein